MSEDRTVPTDETEAAERVDEHSPHQPDRPGTPDEDAAADKARGDLSGDEKDVAEHYEDMAEKGAKAKGEGKIS